MGSTQLLSPRGLPGWAKTELQATPSDSALAQVAAIQNVRATWLILLFAGRGFFHCLAKADVVIQHT
ncbi:hypothetical protein Poly59_20890 [Rubripirellula reticaptiva]|uniref:Uncharacterized protein n=1 Tax=Rubripirellula reticaptiva TaxID=2528013 RepID=A0A5C6F5S8_9BACT|nr:hypothetical protein Poly59_20890 [Rubripirellula reticaptiva]